MKNKAFAFLVLLGSLPALGMKKTVGYWTHKTNDGFFADLPNHRHPKARFSWKEIGSNTFSTLILLTKDNAIGEKYSFLVPKLFKNKKKDFFYMVTKNRSTIFFQSNESGKKKGTLEQKPQYLLLKLPDEKIRFKLANGSSEVVIENLEIKRKRD